MHSFRSWAIGIGPVAVAACVGALGCGSPETTTTETTTSSTTGSGGTGGGGGTGGEALPPLDPEACPITADSGADPAIAESAEEQWSSSYVAPQSGFIQQDKAFFLTTLLGADAALLADIAADPDLSLISGERDSRFRAAPDLCADDVACYSTQLAWDDVDAQIAADSLRALLESTGKLASFASDMRASGRFGLHAPLDDGDLVDIAFTDLTTALGTTFAQEAESLGGTNIHDIVLATSDAHPEPLLFFEPLLHVDIVALAADMRDEAERYEPLAEGENAKALAHIAGIDWSQFPFTVILVPGQGPSNLDTPLDPNGKKRADLAVQRFKAGIAPLIALSGGHVHPDRTPYSEAIEMKKYLMSEHGIPEEALLVDPHARHTTTNLRNVSRLLYRYGVPTDRPLLVTSDFGQSIYIGYWHGMFGPRCLEELGYLPWRSLVPISQNDACMLPVAVSLHADGRDPLDP